MSNIIFLHKIQNTICYEDKEENIFVYLLKIKNKV